MWRKCFKVVAGIEYRERGREREECKETEREEYKETEGEERSFCFFFCFWKRDETTEFFL